MKSQLPFSLLLTGGLFGLCFGCVGAGGKTAAWQLGAPIVTYWAGPAITDATARQMADGGFNLIWCKENELETAARHGLRAMLWGGSFSPASLDTPQQREQLDALIARVRGHPALYSYYVVDEPSASAFPALGKLVAHLRERDPAHLAYINLFPTYANNEQLGIKGDMVTAYREHLRQYLEIVKPALISYDHYQFAAKGDNNQYFLNLAMIRRAALDAGLPFLNIVQACTWTPSMRIPGTNEVRYLVSTTAAYGARGISYYVYNHPKHSGAIALDDGTPTPLYHALKIYNREFAAIARELLPLQSLAVYHTAMKEQGCEPLPDGAPFYLDNSKNPQTPRGFLLGYFGKNSKPTHVMVVNLDYQAEAVTALVGPGRLQLFNALAGKWSAASKPPAELRLAPGEGWLARLAK